jgi:hypothetical protein
MFLDTKQEQIRPFFFFRPLHFRREAAARSNPFKRGSINLR